MEAQSFRPMLLVAVLVAAAAVAGAQQADQSGQYEGVSTPPADDVILSTTTPKAKPPAGTPMYTAPSANVQVQTTPPPVPQKTAPTVQDTYSSARSGDSQYVIGNDDGIVGVAPNNDTYANSPSTYGQPALQHRSYADSNDPDGDIVHPRPARPGELREGTTIQVSLINWLSSGMSEKGEAFQSRVTSDVMQNGSVVIPSGAEIDGHVVAVSSGHFAGHGTLQLRPEAITMPDGTRYQLSAQVTGTRGSNTRVNNEGTITPGSRVKRNAIEYGGGVGVGVIAGAALGGPAGALTGGLIGAGVVTAHLLINHPQAKLEPGSTMTFALTESLDVVPAGRNGN